jgi:hypothetical protein
VEVLGGPASSCAWREKEGAAFTTLFFGQTFEFAQPGVHNSALPSMPRSERINAHIIELSARRRHMNPIAPIEADLCRFCIA